MGEVTLGGIPGVGLFGLIEVTEAGMPRNITLPWALAIEMINAKIDNPAKKPVRRIEASVYETSYSQL